MSKPLKNTGIKRVSDTIDLQRDIGEHRLIRLTAGVGSGKNYWAVKLAEMGYRVLLITSRVVTAQAQAKKMGADRWIDFDRLWDEDDYWGQLPDNAQKKVVCTNAHIRKYVIERYKPDDPKTHIWDKFDFVLLDEAHSLTQDASFSEAPFYVECFLKHAYREGKKCKLILMSGTQEPIDWLFADERSQAVVHNLNIFKECVHIEPERVILRSKDGIEYTLAEKLCKGERIIYFANTTDGIVRLIKALKKAGIPESSIGVSYSKDERDKKFSADLIKRKIEIREALISDEFLPDNIRIFITTSLNKEGVNIENTDIKNVVVETRQHADIMQMAGRVRNGIKNLVILYDAEPHPSSLDTLDVKLDKACLQSVRELAEREAERIDRLVKKVEDRFKTIRYDRLRKTFRLYRGRIRCAEQVAKNNRELPAFIEDYNAPVFENGFATGADMLQSWFPYSEIRVYAYADNVDVKERVIAYLQGKGVIGKRVDNDERDTITQELNEMLLQYPKKMLPEGMKVPFKALAPALKRFDVAVKPVGKNGTAYEITLLDEGEKS